MNARPAIVREGCHCASGCRRSDIDLVCKVVGCWVAPEDRKPIDVECIVSSGCYEEVICSTCIRNGCTQRCG